MPPTEALLVYALTLVGAVLLSGLASRTLLSTTVLFLAAGFVLGPGIGNVISIGPDIELLLRFAEVALVAVLFTDGMRVTTAALRDDWRLPGRALLIGMPLTLVVTALLAHYVAGVTWTAAWLVGAALSPTDPVFARALVGKEAVPSRVQHLLNVESGVNDGIALPIVVVLLTVAGARSTAPSIAVMETATGIALGATVAFVVVKLEASRAFGASSDYLSVAGFAIGLLVFAIAKVTAANEFLASFVAGVTVTAFAPRVANAFENAGEVVVELLKLAAVLAFGALLSRQVLAGLGPREWVFAVTALLVARPLALVIPLMMSRLSWRERATVAWFGPKGFASIFFGIIILGSGVAAADHLFRLVALVVAASIVAHSSTDVLVVRWLARNRQSGS